MKKLSITFIVAVFLTACATTSVEEKAVSNLSLFHTAVMGISAFYYCANGSWPESFTNIEQYEKQRQIMPHVAIQWDQLKQYSQYLSVPTYEMISDIKVSEANSVVVTSGQQPPKCNGKNVELQGAYVNL